MSLAQNSLNSFESFKDLLKSECARMEVDIQGGVTYDYME